MKKKRSTETDLITGVLVFISSFVFFAVCIFVLLGG